jgi:hypothetical protein
MKLLATLGIKSKTLNPTATEAYAIKKLLIAYLYCKCSQKSQRLLDLVEFCQYSSHYNFRLAQCYKSYLKSALFTFT